MKRWTSDAFNSFRVLADSSYCPKRTVCHARTGELERLGIIMSEATNQEASNIPNLAMFLPWNVAYERKEVETNQHGFAE